MTDQASELSPEARSSMLDIAAGAALGGHDLAGFAAVEDYNGDPNGYEAKCRRCGLTAWVDNSGMQYSLLSDVCPGATSEVSG